MTEEVKILYSLQAEHKGLKLWLVSREIATEVRISTLIFCGGKSAIVVLGFHICCSSTLVDHINSYTLWGGKVVFESNVCLAIFAPFPPFHSYAALCEVSISIILLREKSSFRSSIGKPYFPLLLTPRS